MPRSLRDDELLLVANGDVSHLVVVSRLLLAACQAVVILAAGERMDAEVVRRLARAVVDLDEFHSVMAEDRS